jgi:hypothetical protein
MSYDIWLEIDTGGDERANVCDVGNHTSNTSPMWVRALGRSLREYDGRIAGDVADELKAAIAHMHANPDIYESMNPPNGWGSYDSALIYLQKLWAACKAHPRTIIRMFY